MTLKKVRENSFLFVAFSLGWASLYGNVLNFLLILLLIWNWRGDAAAFRQNLKLERYYLAVPCLFLVYMILHTLYFHFFVDNGLKPSYGIFETLLLYFILIPLYMLSMKPWMSVQLMKKALVLFSCGVLLVNVFIFFEKLGWIFFQYPVESLEVIYKTRFGGNRSTLGGFLMLEPQAMILALAAVTAFFQSLVQKKVWLTVLAFLLVIFLSFTVTKASILGFCVGAFLGLIYLFRNLGKREKRITIAVICSMVVVGMFFIPKEFTRRYNETVTEIKNVQDGNFSGVSIAPRLAMWLDAKKHFSEYALFGVGVYYKPILKEWYTSSPNKVLADMPNVHNSFLEYWIKGGIFGLFLIVAFFAFPVVKMIRRHLWSLSVWGGIAVIFIASNTCVLFVHNNSLTIILFWLSAYYFYLKDFNAQERGN